MKIWLLMAFISIFISLRTSKIFENKSQVFERSDWAVTVNNDFYCNEIKIKIKLSGDHVESKILSKKNTK